MLKKLSDPYVIIEILATFTLIVGVALTSLNVYPLNVYVSLFGNFLWLIMGFHWKKLSLITIQVFITILYLGGTIKYLFT